MVPFIRLNVPIVEYSGHSVNPDSEVDPGSAGHQPGHPSRKIAGLPWIHIRIISCVSWIVYALY